MVDFINDSCLSFLKDVSRTYLDNWKGNISVIYQPFSSSYLISDITWGIYEGFLGSDYFPVCLLIRPTLSIILLHLNLIQIEEVRGLSQALHLTNIRR